jgi:alpha-tubulin suppressor-like RCC1 family protein
VVTLTTGVQVAAGELHSCARTTGGTVFCWGKNGNGQLGNNSLIDSHVPVQVMGLTNVIQVACGQTHSCALKSDNTVWCWGLNGNGQLGNNSPADSKVPVQVAGVMAAKLNNAVEIAAGDLHTCARQLNGNEVCWGKNSNGQLGNNSMNDTMRPVQVTPVPSSIVEGIGNGGSHSCSYLDTQSLVCWGNNATGQLGNGSTAQSLVPLPTTLTCP